MKISILSITTLLAAIAAAQQKPLSNAEVTGWMSCTGALLDKFAVGDDGSKAACDLWGCLQLMSSRYSRGGGITLLSRALDPVCGAANLGSNLLPKWNMFQHL